MVIAVQPAPPVTVSVTTADTTLTVGQIAIFTATASAGTGATVTRYEWDLGDGTTQTTTANTISHSYGSAGQKVVRVTAIASDGSEGTGATGRRRQLTATTSRRNGCRRWRWPRSPDFTSKMPISPVGLLGSGSAGISCQVSLDPVVGSVGTDLR